MTKDEAIKIIDCYDIGFYDLSGEKIPADKLAEAFDMAIEALQTDIVHCEECKHYDEGGFCWHPAAELGDTLATEPTDFCSYGERREE